MGCRAGLVILAIVLSAILSLSPASAAEADSEPTGETASSVTWSGLTASEQARAESWELTPTEWRRYQALMAGIRGSVSPDSLSPVEVLGIHARNEAERTRYAERWAILMREDAERTLAFQRAYDAAYERLFPEESLIERARLPAKVIKTPILEPTDRILLFLRPDCAACEAVLERVLAKRGAVAGIDLYFRELGVCAVGTEI